MAGAAALPLSPRSATTRWPAGSATVGLDVAALGGDGQVADELDRLVVRARWNAPAKLALAIS